MLEEEEAAAEEIWDYLKLNHKLEKTDLIAVFGNPDLRTAEYATRLWLDGFAKWLLLSGKEGTLTKGKWPKPEAEVFKDIAVSHGVPEENIFVEREATNTGENVTFSHKLLHDNGLLESVKSIILVQMPFMERRTYATFVKQWPDGINKLDKIIVTSPAIDFKSYPIPFVGDMHDIIQMMLGCLKRLKTYPNLGFQIEQEIPTNILEAEQKLISSGSYSSL